MDTPPTLSAAANAVLALVRRNRTGTSFVEIANALTGAGYDPKGDLALSHPTDENLIMWANASDDLVGALNELLAARLVHYAPTEPLVYLYDGGALNLPLAKRPPQSGYREPHWVPIVINEGPAPSNP